MKRRNWTKFKQQLYKWLVKGAVVLVPLVVTIIVFSIVLNFLTQFLSPFTALLNGVISNWFGNFTLPYLTEFVAIIGLLVIMTIMGIALEVVPMADELTHVFHAAVEWIPGVGAVYGSFRRLSQSMMSDEGSYRDVKLIEYPDKGAYTLGFVTAGEATPMSGKNNEQLITLFVPMAPNPFMGGFVVHLPEERVHDVDLSVQEGIKSTVTSGIALGQEVEDSEIGEDIDSFNEELDDVLERFKSDRK